MRGLTKVVEIEGKDWTVRELAIYEIRQWLASIADGEGDALDLALVPGIHLSAIRLMCGATIEQWQQWLPSEQDRIIEAAKVANPRFFTMMERMTDAVQKTP